MVDVPLAERLRRTMFAGSGTDVPRTTVRLPCDEGGYLGPDRLDHLFALLGATDDGVLVVGWFAGGAAPECAVLLGPPAERIVLKPGWDVDWSVWRIAPPEARRVAEEVRSGPNLLFSERDGWLLFLSPSAFEAHLNAEPLEPASQTVGASG